MLPEMDGNEIFTQGKKHKHKETSPPIVNSCKTRETIEAKEKERKKEREIDR